MARLDAAAVSGRGEACPAYSVFLCGCQLHISEAWSGASSATMHWLSAAPRCNICLPCQQVAELLRRVNQLLHKVVQDRLKCTEIYLKGTEGVGSMVLAMFASFVELQTGLMDAFRQSTGHVGHD